MLNANHDEQPESDSSKGGGVQKARDVIVEGATKLKRPQGMTLVEIMIVVTIMAAIAGAVGVFVFGALDRANIRTAEVELGQIQQGVDMYYADHGELPSSFDDITEGDLAYVDDIGDDPWGNEYVFERHDARSYEICSPGPDGSPGTDDDVCVDT